MMTFRIAGIVLETGLLGLAVAFNIFAGCRYLQDDAHLRARLREINNDQIDQEQRHFPA